MDLTYIVKGDSKMSVDSSAVDEIPFSERNPIMAANQLEKGHRMARGAAIESTKKANFARGILWKSVKGVITLPTVKLLK